jgi:hypothetical protein
MPYSYFEDTPMWMAIKLLCNFKTCSLPITNSDMLFVCSIEILWILHDKSSEPPHVSFMYCSSKSLPSDQSNLQQSIDRLKKDKEEHYKIIKVNFIYNQTIVYKLDTITMMFIISYGFLSAQMMILFFIRDT